MADGCGVANCMLTVCRLGRRRFVLVVNFVVLGLDWVGLGWFVNEERTVVRNSSGE